jgi:hypothetical protein
MGVSDRRGNSLTTCILCDRSIDERLLSRPLGREISARGVASDRMTVCTDGLPTEGVGCGAAAAGTSPSGLPPAFPVPPPATLLRNPFIWQKVHAFRFEYITGHPPEIIKRAMAGLDL